MVLVPTPSYPLFDHLTRLDAVEAGRYALRFHGRWEVDVDSMDAAWSARTTAMLAVSPNNPTGSVWSEPEWQDVTARCASRGAALIVDEVFADYPLEGRALPIGPRSSDALVFRLGGLSKSAALPQVKLGWIAVEGPPSLVGPALERLELICDTYLSVSTPVQVAAPALIAGGAGVRRQIQDRIERNYAALRDAAAADPSVQLLPVDGGWSAVLRVPARIPEEDLVVTLLEQRDTLVHPGFFFDFPHEAFLVFSLLPRPEDFTEGVRRVMEHLHE
jgi:aspartate/methionine/tyrosine aminotransferase